MITFSTFVHTYNLKNKATSNIKNYQVFSSIGLDNVNIYLRDGLLESNTGILKLHPEKRTHWVAYLNEFF